MPWASKETPGSPSSAEAIMNSEGFSAGNSGKKGTSSWRANCSPNSLWVCGRLPMAVVACGGKSASAERDTGGETSLVGGGGGNYATEK